MGPPCSTCSQSYVVHDCAWHSGKVGSHTTWIDWLTEYDDWNSLTRSAVQIATVIGSLRAVESRHRLTSLGIVASERGLDHCRDFLDLMIWDRNSCLYHLPVISGYTYVNFKGDFKMILSVA